MNNLMQVLRSIGLSICLVGIIRSDVTVAKAGEMKLYRELISKADVVHLDGAVIVERVLGYQVKWNSSTLLPVAGKANLYGEHRLVGGTNNSQQPLRVVALIPFFEFRGVQNPNLEIVSVMVNRKPAQCFLFLPGKQVKEAIDAARHRFPTDKLFSTQLDPSAPLLFINAGVVAPKTDIRLEYDVKPRSMIVN